MNNIKEYIFEKLHLNKDIEVANDKELKKDDEFFCISADIMFGEINIKLYYPMTVKKITEKKITYITNAGKTLIKEYFINSNGFYEMKPNGSFTAIAMTVDYGIELLEKILNGEEVDKNFLYKYFDIEDEWIDDYSVKKDYTDDTVRKIINSLQTKNYVSEKLHLNKDIKIKDEFKYVPEDKSDLRILVKKFIAMRGDNADLNDIDTHRIKDMSYLFYDEKDIKNINISNWDTSNVTNMEGMFYNCYKFNGDISSWDVSNVTNMDKMFSQCLEFNQDLNNWKVNDKCSMNWIFSGCNKLKKKPSWFKKIR